jgi:hypothetical protein
MKNTLRRQHGGYARQQRRASVGVGACVNVRRGFEIIIYQLWFTPPTKFYYIS